MHFPSTAVANESGAVDFSPANRSTLERPVLTVTGAVGLLLGSLAWVVTDQFAAAPLVFIASLTTALSLASVLQTTTTNADADCKRAKQELASARRRLATLEATVPDMPSAAPAGGPRDLEMNDLLTSAVTLVRPFADRRGVVLRAEPEALFLAIHADAARLRGALDALLADAVAQTPRGGAVRVAARLAGDRVVAEIFAEAGGGCTLSLPFGHRARAATTDVPPPAAVPAAPLTAAARIAASV